MAGPEELKNELVAEELQRFVQVVAAKNSPSEEMLEAAIRLIARLTEPGFIEEANKKYGTLIVDVLTEHDRDNPGVSMSSVRTAMSEVDLGELKGRLLSSYNTLLLKWIDSRKNITDTLATIVEAESTDKLKTVLKVPGLKEGDYGFIHGAAQEKITTILREKIETVPANKLDSLNMIILNQESFRTMYHAMRLAHEAEYEFKGEFKADKALTGDQYGQLVNAAKEKAKSLVQDKLKAAHVPVDNLDEEKTVFNALIAVANSPSLTTLEGNAAALKLTTDPNALIPGHVGALDASVYEAEAIKADALKLADDFIVAKLNALGLAADNEALLRELQAALTAENVDEAAAKVSEILGDGFAPITGDHLGGAPFKEVIRNVINAKVAQIDAGNKNAFDAQVDDVAGFSDGLKTYLKDHSEAIQRHQRKHGSNSSDLLKSLEAAKDPRSIRSALVKLGVPEGDKDLNTISAAQVEFIQKKAGEAVDSRLAGVRQERGHMWMPGGHKYENKKWAIGTSCSNFVAIGSYLWGKWGPSGGLDESRARTFLQGAAVVTGVVVAEAIAAPALLLATVWEAGRYAAITPLKAAAQYSTKRDFPEIDQSIALLQAELEAADRNPEATISPKVLASVEEQYTRLKELKLRYQNRGKKDDNVDVEACTRRLTKIEALKARVLVLKADPGEYIFKTKVRVVDMKEDGGNEALYDVMRALEGVGAAGGAVPSIRGAGEVKDDKDKSLSKGEFKSIDATHVLLVKMDVGPEQTSWAVCREEKEGKPVVSVYNHSAHSAPVALPEGAAAPSVPENNYKELKRKDFKVIAWAVELVNIYLERPGSNKDAIEITPGSGPQKLTQQQIDALYIYCYRQGMSCEPTGLNSLCSKEVRANMDKYAKEQSTVIEKHFTSTHGPELKAGLKSDATDKEKTDREDILAKKAKYLSKSEREHVLEKGEKGRTLSSVFKRRI